MYLYGLKFSVTDNVPCFDKKLRSIKKYNDKKGIYYCSRDNEKISRYSVDSYANRYGWTWYTTEEKREEAKRFLLDRYITETEEWLKNNETQLQKRHDDLKTTKKYFDLMFGKDDSK